MYRVIRVIIDDDRRIRVAENIELPPSKQALLVILDEPGQADALLSERALSNDWNRVEEDRVWQSLQ